jgi:Ca-activated chloride channel homolog
MSFLSPVALWLLLPVAALAGAYVVLQQRRRHYAVRFTNLDLLASVAPRRPGWRRHVAAALAGLGLVALVVGLARPTREVLVPRDSATVVLVVDVSASMTATDIAPSRLAAARDAARDFVADVPEGFRLGLVAFDRSARLLAPPTTDHASVTSAIERLEPGAGTATGDGLRLALDTIESSFAELDLPEPDPAEGPVASIVLLSDGVATAGTPIAVAAAEARAERIPVTTIAYGTAGGTVTIQGQVIPVPADEESMRSLAETTGGEFFTAGSADELRDVYEDVQNVIGHTPERREVTLTFVSVAVVLLLLATSASLFWSARFL